MSPDLFTNIWCSFLDGVQTQTQAPASATSCPAPSQPGLLHPGEQQGWEELVRGQQGIGLLFPSRPRDAGASLGSEGHGDSPEALVARHGPCQEGTDGLCLPSPSGKPGPCQAGS